MSTPSIDERIERAAVLVEALPYIQRFSGHVLVIKLGGAVDASDAGIDSVLRDIVLLHVVGMRPVLVHGADPNWGRIVAALGRSGAAFTLDRCSVSIGGHAVLQHGTPAAADLAQVSHALRQPRVDIDIGLGQGEGRGHCWGCDLTAGYVSINADYTT